jgi:hypothetical protein
VAPKKNSSPADFFAVGAVDPERSLYTPTDIRDSGGTNERKITLKFTCILVFQVP